MEKNYGGEASDPHPNRLGYNVELHWKKKFTKCYKKGKNCMNIPADIVRKGFCADHSNLTLMDFDDLQPLDCQVLKGKNPHSEMYLGKGWYEYGASRNLSVGDVLLFHYFSYSEMLYVKHVKKDRVKYVISDDSD
ncbi:uncharacterized protein LOC131630034 [Vicia villosa]|uniref:uncharacterized protein LOC131630034 n=1 Tax=Vicia villosa TaxID=3911 RepID=UPI00273AC8B9|nr:uncharacterized protein LOC131630034 [Vicia villosa]